MEAAKLQNKEDDDDDNIDHEGEGHGGVLHEESFHPPLAKPDEHNRLEAAVQAAVSIVDQDAHSAARYLGDAWRRVNGWKASDCAMCMCVHASSIAI